MATTNQGLTKELLQGHYQESAGELAQCMALGQGHGWDEFPYPVWLHVECMHCSPPSRYALPLVP